MSQSFITGPYTFTCDCEITDEMEDCFRKVAEKAFNDAHDRMLNAFIYGTSHPEMYDPAWWDGIGDRYGVDALEHQRIAEGLNGLQGRDRRYMVIDPVIDPEPSVTPKPDTKYQQAHGGHNGMSFPSNRRSKR